MSEYQRYSTVEVAIMLIRGNYNRPGLRIWDHNLSNSPSPAFRQPRPRVETGLVESERIYQGRMYTQGNKHTCLPWALTNATAALGLRPSSRLLVKLLNKSLDLASKTQAGISPAHMEAGLSEEPAQKFRIELVEAGLASTHPQWSMFDDERERSIPELARRIEAAITRRNAALLKHRLDLGEVFILHMDNDLYAGDGMSGTHSIAAVGYSVSGRSFMDVQVLDSARGNLILPLEHISHALEPLTQVVKRNDRLSVRAQEFDIDPIIDEVVYGGLEFGLGKP